MGVFERVVIEEVVQLGAVVFVVGVLGFDSVGVDGDGGSIGEQEFYASGVHVEMAVDGGDGVVHDGKPPFCFQMVSVVM